MRTAVVGLGNIGSTVARNLVKGGQKITVADKTLAKAESLAKQLGGNVTSSSLDDALRSAGVIILATWLDAIRDLVEKLYGELSGKIVVDPSNPIAPDGKGGFTKTLSADESSGKLVSQLLPEDAKLVKAFGTVSAISLASAAHRAPERAVLFYATDYSEAARVVSRLITASGFTPMCVGGIEQSIRIEVGGDLDESGKLGKLVSAAEALRLI